jgi:hypothetical protein
VLYGQRNTLNRVLDVDETSRLATSAINGDGVVVGHLGTKTIQNSSIVAIDINPIDQHIVHLSLFGTYSPYNTLV